MKIDTLYIISQVAILIDYIFLIITYQLKNRKTILAFNFIAKLPTAISYLCLSAWSGLAMVFVTIIRNVIFLIDESKNGKRDYITKKDIIILIILYVISIIFTIYTYQGILSLMSVVGTMLYTYSIWQKSTKIYKLLGIPIEIIWIIYNIYIMSIFGIVFETILLISSIIGFTREVKNNGISLQKNRTN